MSTYFVKYSYINPNQPLIRVHGNDELNFDITEDSAYWEMVSKLQSELRRDDSENFTIDFMMEMK